MINIRKFLLTAACSIGNLTYTPPLGEMIDLTKTSSAPIKPSIGLVVHPEYFQDIPVSIRIKSSTASSLTRSEGQANKRYKLRIRPYLNITRWPH